MRTDDLDYHLPEALIAQTPADRRDAARLMVVESDSLAHHVVADLPDLLQPGDLIVLNDTRVIPARFRARRAATGGAVEGLYLESDDHGRWHVMLRCGGRLRPGETLVFEGTGDADHRLVLRECLPDGTWHVETVGPTQTLALLERIGTMPLPPYIQRRRDNSTDLQRLDHDRYQTVYADEPGSVAAPTAGLHFTHDLLDRLRERGVEIARLTLHVGMGTFAPVRSQTLEAHAMHRERFAVPKATLDALGRAHAARRPVIAIGTTSVRALESLPDPLPDADWAGSTDLLIQPGYTFRHTDGLFTNFHLPRSTLIALVAAKVGLARLLELYQRAITERYRFYSYGDAMLIQPGR